MPVAIPPTYVRLWNFTVNYNRKNKWVNLYNIVPTEMATRDKPTEEWGCNWEYLIVGMWHPVHQILTLFQIKEYNFLHSFFFFFFLLLLLFFSISIWYEYIRNSLINKKKENLLHSFWELGPVVQTPVSANPQLHFNPGFFFLLSKAPSLIILSSLFRVSNHQIVGKAN